MAIKTISQFPSGIPADNDYILFEQNGEGKSAKFSDFSLSYEEIMATNPEPDLSGKVASASAVKDLKIKSLSFSSAEADSGGNFVTNLPIDKIPVVFKPSDRNGWPFVFARHKDLSSSYWLLHANDYGGNITGTVKGTIYYLEGV